MAQQKDIHCGRMEFFNEIVKLQGKVIDFSRQLRSNLSHNSQETGINLEI